MAPGGSRPRRPPHRSTRRNPPLTDPVEDELTRDPGPVTGLHSGNISPAPSYNPTLGPDQVSALIPALALVLASAPTLTDELFKKFMKAYLESNQGPRQPPAEREWSLKAKVPEIYYGNPHMDCYHFCQ